MRRIEKTPREPAVLLAYRKTAGGGGYDDFPDKEALKVHLDADQRGLCCYCMRRTRAAEGRVEHHASQARHPERALEWGNMMLACALTEGQRPAHQTCDVRKGDADIRISPLDDSVTWVNYGFTAGSIDVDEGDMQRDVDERLNLNHPSLQRYRRDAVDGLKDGLKQKLGPTGSWTRRKLEHELENVRTEAPLRPFAGLLEAYLERLLRGRTR